jgi:hypothetical protein
LPQGEALALRFGLNFDTASPASELFFWNPMTGKNRIVRDIDGAASMATNVVNPLALNHGDLEKVVAGDFDSTSAGSELFFWNPTTGMNRLVGNLGGVPSVATNLVNPLAINNREFEQVVAADFDTSSGIELFFWNPPAGAQRGGNAERENEHDQPLRHQPRVRKAGGRRLRQ